MNQKNKYILIETTFCCILVALLTFLIYKLNGVNAETYILLCVIAILLNIVLNLGLSVKSVLLNGAHNLVSLGKWIMPIAGIAYLMLQIYSLIFQKQNIMGSFICVFLGILFIICGNNFPKNHINPYVGLKFPWLLRDEEGWYKTHRLGGYTWILSGIVFILHPLHRKVIVTVPLIILLVGIIPLIYSVFLFYQRKEKGK